MTLQISISSNSIWLADSNASQHRSEKGVSLPIHFWSLSSNGSQWKQWSMYIYKESLCLIVSSIISVCKTQNDPASYFGVSANQSILQSHTKQESHPFPFLDVFLCFFIVIYLVDYAFQTKPTKNRVLIHSFTPSIQNLTLSKISFLRCCWTKNHENDDIQTNIINQRILPSDWLICPSHMCCPFFPFLDVYQYAKNLK